MQTVLLTVFLLALAVFLGRSVLRTRALAAKLNAGPDPVRIAIMQQEAITMALAAVEHLQEAPEVKAKRRQAILATQKNIAYALAV